MTFEPGDGPRGEPDRAFLAFIRQDLGIGQARGVIDGDVDKFPAGSALVALSPPIAGDAMADAVDSAEVLDVNMDQLTGPLALIADDLGLGVEAGEAAKAASAQGKADGGCRTVQPARDDGTAEALSAQGLDPLSPRSSGKRLGLWRGRQEQSRRPLSPSCACRARHLRAGFGQTPCAAATALTDQPLVRRWTISNRLWGVVRAL